MQMHYHRSEHWVIIFGVATCVVDGQPILAGRQRGHSDELPDGSVHQIRRVVVPVATSGPVDEDDVMTRMMISLQNYVGYVTANPDTPLGY